jgi:hypothetical protein
MMDTQALVNRTNGSEIEHSPSFSKEPSSQQLFGVPPALLRQVVDLLQAELPMKRVRHLVEALEQVQLLAIRMDEPK